MSIALHLGPERVLGLAGIYGQTTFTTSYEAPRPAGESEAGVTLPPAFRKMSYNSYLLPAIDRSQPIVSTLNAPVAAWPRHIFLGVGDCDTLCVPNKLLHEKLEAGGHRGVELMTVEHVNHGFDKMVKPGSEVERKRDDMYERAIAVLKTARGQ